MKVEVGGVNPGFGIVPYAESVTPGHPDIACNLASDNVLDKAIEKSGRVRGRPRVALEVTAKAGINVAGENLDLFPREIQEVVKQNGLVVAVGEVTLPSGIHTFEFKLPLIEGFRMAGYNDPSFGFYPTPKSVLVAITSQSADIASGVDIGGAGDQGAMVGFATRETAQFMPLAAMVARDLTRRQFEMFKEGSHNKALRPDGKSQVILRQEARGGKLVTTGINNLTIAVAHDPLLPIGELRELLREEQIQPVLDRYDLQIDEDTQLVINGCGDGRWTVFGPQADAGTENRKLMVQAYGLAARHGGGGWSGKDPTKVDRSGALFARHIALSLVAGGIVDTAEVSISYSIGRPDPHVIRVNTYGTNASGWTDERIGQLVKDNFAWSVGEMLDRLNLWQPVYARTNIDGVFGVTDYPWEKPTEIR